MSERDTQFAGFAKLLWEEIQQSLHFTGSLNKPDFQSASFDEHMQKVIARRIYDLVCHVCDEVERLEDLEERFWIGRIAEFKKWPEDRQ